MQLYRYFTCPIFIASTFLVLFSSVHCIVSEDIDQSGSPPNKLLLREGNSSDWQADAQKIVSDELQGFGLNSSKEINIEKPSQLRLRTVLSSSFSRILGPMIMVGASTFIHATLFRGMFPPLFKALKSSELGNVDLSPDAISRNTADFIMDYVCEVLSAFAQILQLRFLFIDETYSFRPEADCTFYALPHYAPCSSLSRPDRWAGAGQSGCCSASTRRRAAFGR